MYYSKQLTLQEELSSLLATSISTFYSEIPEFPLNITIIKYFTEENSEARKSTLFQCPRLSVSWRCGAYQLETISAHTIFITKWTEYGRHRYCYNSRQVPLHTLSPPVCVRKVELDEPRSPCDISEQFHSRHVV